MNRFHRFFPAAILAVALLPLPSRAFAQDWAQGNACTTVNRVYASETDSRASLICDGSNLQYYLRGEGNPVRLGVATNTPQATLDVNGGLRVGTTSTCAAANEGTIRYTAASDLWEFCNGSVWTNLSSGGGAAISGLTAAGGTNTINNATYAQEWQWNTLAGGTGLKLSSTSTAAASNAQKLFEIALSGANGTATQTTYGGYITNAHTGATSTNVGLYAAASGGTTNIPVYARTGGATDATVLEGLRIENEDTDTAGTDGIGTALTFWNETETAGTFNESARIAGVFEDAANGSRDGQIRFYVPGPNAASGAASSEKMRLTTWGPLLPNDSNITINAYYDQTSGFPTYLTTNDAFGISHDDATNSLEFWGAASGTAGNSISRNIAMQIDETGQVGIGNSFYNAYSLPDAPLHVRPMTTTNSSILEGLRLDNLDNDSAGTDGIGSAITFYAETETDGTHNQFARIEGVADDAANGSRDGSLRFSTVGPNAASGAAAAERMRIDSSGNVGIGTTAPGTLLQLHQPTGSYPKLRLTAADVTLPSFSGSGSLGDVSASNTIGQIRNGMNPTTDANAGGLIVQGFTGSGVTDQFPLRLVGTHGASAATTTAAVTISGQKWNGTTNRAALGTGEIVLDVETKYADVGNGNAAPLLRVMGNGNVGIGTASPDAILTLASDVENGIRIYQAAANDAHNPYIWSRRAKGTVASPTAVDVDTILMEQIVQAYDGTGWVFGGHTAFVVDGTSGTNDMPTRYEINVQADGAGAWMGDNDSVPEFVIKSSGNVGLSTASPQSTLHVPDGKYAQFEDNNAGAPPGADCDADAERGRMSIDTTNNRPYICNGATRGWDYVALSN